MTEENTTPVTEETKAPEAAASESSQPKKDAAPAQNDGKPQRNRRVGNRGRRPEREPKEFEEAILKIDRVTRVTKGGRQLRFRVSVVIGDKKGRVGFGIGKSEEVMVGIQKAVAKAKQALITVPIYADTIPHSVKGTFKASQVFLLPAEQGKGVIAGGSVRKILELSGVKNVLSKIHGSRNKLNTAYATFEALAQLQDEMPHGLAKAKAAAKAEEAASVEEKPKAETKKEDKPAEKKAPAKKATPKKTSKK